VTFVESAVEDDPLRGMRVDWVYSRFLLMHVGDIRRALRAIADMLSESGALLLEIADVGSLQFQPATPESELWRPWWYALGRVRGASYDVAEQIEEMLDQTGFAIERCDRYQPVSSSPAGQTRARAGIRPVRTSVSERNRRSPDQIEAHYAFLRHAVHDPAVMVALFHNTQYIARLR